MDTSHLYSAKRRVGFLAAFGGFAVFALSLSAAILPDTLTVTNVDVTGDGLPDTIILNKRSVRAANYRVWTWTTNGGYVQVTNVPPVSTYRGYVQSDPSLRVNGFVNYLGKVSLNVTEGRNNSVARPEDVTVDLSGPPGTADPGTGNIEIPLVTNRVSPTAQGFLIPRTHMRKLRVGLDTTGSYCAKTRFGGDIALMIAAAEQRINDSDMFYARDMGLAWEITDVVLRLNGDPANWKTFWNGSDGITPRPFNTKVRLDSDTGGGSAGTVFSATADFPNSHSVTTGGPDKWESASIGHEVGHGLGVGHYSSYNDTMSGSESSLGSGTVQRMIEQMQLASAVSAPAIIYGAPLAPYAMEDFANTLPGQSVDINVLANDYDGNGDALHIAYVAAVSDAGGTVTNLGGGVVRYTPAPGHAGVDRFRYHVADSGGIENRTGLVKIYTRSPGLANHWLLDETNGVTVWDVGPYQAHGTVGSGMTPLATGTQTGVIGNAYENLVGGVTSTSTQIGCDAGDPLDGDLSVSAWVKFNTLTNRDLPILTKGGGVISERLDNIRGGWEIAVVGGSFYFACKTEPDLNNTNAAAVLQSGTAVATNQWYHLAMVMNRTTKQLRAWVNNVEVLSSPVANTTIADGFIENYWPLQMFACSHDDVSLAGVLDDVRIYNQALSSVEVAGLFAANDEIPAGAPVPRNPTTLVSTLNPLAWIPGRPNRYAFQVYLGTNLTAVSNATTNSPEYLGVYTTNSAAPALAVSTAYYWRVDEVTTNGVVVPGAVWRFTTKATVDHLFDNGGGDGIWTNAVNWSPDGAPQSNRDYFVTGNFTAISPGALEDLTPRTYTFGGNSLTVSEGATLNLKKLNSGGTDFVDVNITNLTVRNATLMTECARNLDLSLNTSVNFEGANTLFLGGGAFQRWLRFKGGLSGSGSLHLYRDSTGTSREVYLVGGNFAGYAGDWLVERTAGTDTNQVIDLICQTAGGWGGGQLTLGTSARLTVATNVDAPTATLNFQSVSAVASIATNRTLRISGLQGTGGSITNGAGAILKVGTGNDSRIFGGVISGGGSLVKEGSGVFTLTGANTYTGTTTVTTDSAEGGKLLVNGSLANTAVTVGQSCVLGGTGTLTGPVLVNGTLAPGDSGTGNLTINNTLSLATGSTIAWDCTDWAGVAGTGYDTITATSLNLTSATLVTISLSQLALTNFTATNRTFTLVQTTAGIAGFATNKFTIDSSGFPAAGGAWSVQLSGNNLVLIYAPTPWQAWQHANFGTNASNSAIAGELADPDRDGFSNLMEYALATNPNASGASNLAFDLETISGSKYLRLTVTKNPAATDILYAIEVGGDLTDWNTNQVVTEQNDANTLIARDTVVAARRFIRLRVTHP